MNRLRIKKSVWKKLRGKPRRYKAEILKVRWLKVGKLVRFRKQRQPKSEYEWSYDPGIHRSDNVGCITVNKRTFSTSVTKDDRLFGELCMVLELRKPQIREFPEAKVLFEEEMFWVSARDLKPCKTVLQRKIEKNSDLEIVPRRRP